MLSLDLETKELVVTGPAHKTWTESKFRRKMPEFMYQFIGLTNAMRDETQVSMDTTQDGTSDENHQHQNIP